MATVTLSKVGVKVLQYLCSPRDPHLFGKGTVDLLAQGDGNCNSKKDPSMRRAELFRAIATPLLTYIAAQTRALLYDHGSQTPQLVLAALGEPDPSPFAKEIPPEQRTDCYKAIAEIATDEFIPCNVDGPLHVIEHPQSHFVLTLLLAADRRRALARKTVRDQEQEIATTTEPIVTLSGTIATTVGVEKLAEWTACNKGCFVLFRMFDSGDVDATTAVNSAVKLSLSRLRGYSFAGAKLLLEKVAEKTT